MDQLRRYLEALHAEAVEVLNVRPLGSPGDAQVVKAFGYGAPVLVQYSVAGQVRRAVLETAKPGQYGHEHMADRAREPIRRTACCRATSVRWAWAE